MFTQLNSLRSLRFVNDLALNSAFAFRLVFIKLLSVNGDGEIRTLDPLLARQVLSQLSYTPMKSWMWVYPFKAIPVFFFLWFVKPMGLSGLEPPTSRLSGVRSNQLSYKPINKSGTHLLSHTVSSIVPSAA